MMICEGGRPLRSCDFPAGIVFFGEKEEELWHPSKDMIRPKPRSRALVRRHILRIQIPVEQNLIYLINARLEKRKQERGYHPIRLGEECCWGRKYMG